MFIHANTSITRRLLSELDLYAASDWPVLLLGETGVGKEVLARRVHQGSTRARGPFVAVNCAAIPAGLFESELFGFERGAFSGAQQSSRGLVRQASGGTLFLDEIGDLDLSLQVKLLRLLDSGEVRSVGAARSDQVSCRILAATNVDLASAVSQGRFRADLWERLAVLAVEIPPLRDRKPDIEPIALYWLEQMGAEADSRALEALCGYDWPGNTRQLRNLLARATVLGRRTVTFAIVEALLGEARALPVPGDPLSGSLADIEKRVIVDRVRQCHGNRKKAAQKLGIAKSTLHDKLRKWREQPSSEEHLRPSLPLRVSSPGPSLHGATGVAL